MKLFDSTKKKVVAGVTAFALVSGVGLSFAATDIGTQLKEWYEGQFNVAVEDAADGAEQYVNENLSEWENELEDRKDHHAGIIDRDKDLMIGKASGDIDAEKASRLEDLENAKQNLLDEAGQKFYNEFVSGVAEINSLAQQAEEYANENVSSHLNDTGKAAVDEVNEQLEKVKNDAVTELEEAVKNAEAELQADLDEKSAALEGNYVTQIDHAIDDIRRSVKDVAESLVNEQKALIADAADTKYEEAVDALDGVTVGENN